MEEIELLNEKIEELSLENEALTKEISDASETIRALREKIDDIYSLAKEASKY
jgi:predicted  nucleic acid-binding Zn-ribbon protein